MQYKFRDSILAKIILYPFSLVYMLLIIMRNLLYDWGIFNIRKFNIPVISVGNIVAGGTGKTPVIMYLIQNLKPVYRTIVVVSRGYGRTTRGTIVVSDGQGKIISADEGGDEPVMIARKNNTVPVIVSEKRTAGISLAQELFHPDLILLDDAFQHRQTYRDLDILLVNASKNPRKELILPAGDRREPIFSINRANFIIYTKSDDTQKGCDPFNLAGYCDNNLFYAQYEPVYLINFHTHERVPLSQIKGKSILAFSGIADPGSFLRILDQRDVRVTDSLFYPDHHRYNEADIRVIKKMARDKKCLIFLTTEKDAVKIDPTVFKEDEMYILEMQVIIHNGAELLEKIRKMVDMRI